MRTPTYGEIEAFCRSDGWHEVRSTKHIFFEKRLQDGRVLQTHRSSSTDKTMSPGRFKAILATQLEVSADDFWETLRTGDPAPRPSAPPPPPDTVPLYAVRVLMEHDHLSLDEIAGMGRAAAERRVQEIWAGSA